MIAVFDRISFQKLGQVMRFSNTPRDLIIILQE